MLVLASRSPRRGEILRNAGIPFVVRLPDPVDEQPRAGETPREYVMRLAREKAEATRRGLEEIVLGADTAVVVDEHILGKPEDKADARRMLELLSARQHEVMTGICLQGAAAIEDVAVTSVWFAPMSTAEMDAYIESGEPMDKAGAYAIQGLGSRFVERIEGCYFNVVGLPVALVYRHWKRLRDGG
jgi:septum formation protein